jgi:hypothetical protein
MGGNAAVLAHATDSNNPTVSKSTLGGVMHPDSAYHVPVRPRDRSRRWLLLLIIFLMLILASYWIPERDRLGGSLGNRLLKVLTRPDSPRLLKRAFLLTLAPIRLALMAIPACSIGAIVLAVLALRVPHSGIRVLLIVITTSIIGLIGWLMLIMDDLWPLDVTIQDVPGVYVGLAASVAAWIAALAAHHYGKNVARSRQ